MDEGPDIGDMGVSAGLGDCVSKRLEPDVIRRFVLFDFTITDVDVDRRASLAVERGTDDCRCAPDDDDGDEDDCGIDSLPDDGLDDGDLGRKTTCTHVSASCIILLALSLEPSKNSRRS